MLTEGTRVRILRFDDIPFDLLPDEAVNWRDEEPDRPVYIYGLGRDDIDDDRAKGDGIVWDVHEGFDGVDLDCRIRFDNGRLSQWRYNEQMLEFLDEESPLVVPESDPVSFLFA